MEALKPMKFDSKRENQFIAMNNNTKYLYHVPLKREILIKYALLLCHYPFNDKQTKVFNKLKREETAGYLFRYLLKIAKLVNVPKPLIDNLYKSNETRKIFKNEKTYCNLDEELVTDLFNKKFDDIKDKYNNHIIQEKYTDDFVSDIYLFFNVVFWCIDKNSERKVKLENIFDIK